MRNKEFSKWEKDIYSPPIIKDNGDVENDNVIKFELSYPDATEVKKETILAITLAEAIYSSLYNILIGNLPTESEVMGASTKEDYDKISKRLLDSLSFEKFKFSGFYTEDDNVKGIKFKYCEKEYTITSESIDFNKVYDIRIDDDMAIVWSYDLEDSNTTCLCSIAYNMMHTTINPKYFREITDLKKLSDDVRYNLYPNRNFLVVKFGYTSLIEGDSFSNEFAKEISYKRAILKKLEFDKKILNKQLEYLKESKEALDMSISRHGRIARHVNKRISDTNKYIEDKINSIYGEKSE